MIYLYFMQLLLKFNGLPVFAAGINGEMATKASCIICLGQEGPLSKAEIKLKVTSKGLQTVIKSCRERQDEVSRRLLPILEESSETPQIHFHFKCRSQLTSGGGSIPASPANYLNTSYKPNLAAYTCV